MTQEERLILIRDLSSRLCSGVTVNIKYSKENGSSDRLRICSEGDLLLNTDLLGLFIEQEIELKPYLRSLSKMTEEEKEELKLKFDAAKVTNYYIGFSGGGTLEDYIEEIRFSLCGIIVEWLIEHHLDFRGLIEKGLAIEE